MISSILICPKCDMDTLRQLIFIKKYGHSGYREGLALCTICDFVRHIAGGKNFDYNSFTIWEEDIDKILLHWVNPRSLWGRLKNWWYSRSIRKCM